MNIWMYLNDDFDDYFNLYKNSDLVDKILRKKDENNLYVYIIHFQKQTDLNIIYSLVDFFMKECKKFFVEL